MKERIVEIDSLKGFAIFLVIAGHAIIVYPINLQQQFVWCGFLQRFIYMFHMPLFFMISGFCFSYYGDYVKFIKKKIERLLIPYLAFSFITLVPRTLFTSLVNRTNLNTNPVKKYYYIAKGIGLYMFYLLFL